MSLSLDQLTLFLFIFVRMTGMIALNPIFSRRNLPARARMVLVVGMTLLLAPVVDPTPLAGLSSIVLVVSLVKELIIGLVCTYVFQIFYYLLYFVGDVMDMQFGLSMARVFDPGSNVQASVSGNLLTLFFSVYFFATNSHLILLRVFAASFDVVPVASGIALDKVAEFALVMFVSVFSLAVHLALPFIAVEFIIEMSMGILMKLIPQIHVFVLNIQVKVLAALAMLLLFAPTVSNFIDHYVSQMLLTIQEALQVLAG